MDVSELTRALEQGRTTAAWVDAIGRFFAAQHLSFGHGTDNPEDEALWLVRACQGWGPDTPPDPKLIPSVVQLAERRARERKPLAYLLGEAWFAGLRFEIDERVLIPRSPLAELIERGFAPWCRLMPGDRVLDVGTGSGCVAVAVAHHCGGVHVDATDLSAAALDVASANVSLHGLEDRVRLIRSDLFEHVEGRYRMILSNPPYVPRGNLRALPREYAHEPELALDGGPTGLDVIDRLLSGAARHLLPGGALIAEVGEAQDALTERHPALPATWLLFERGGEGVLMLTREELTGYFQGRPR